MKITLTVLLFVSTFATAFNLQDYNWDLDNENSLVQEHYKKKDNINLKIETSDKPKDDKSINHGRSRPLFHDEKRTNTNEIDAPFFRPGKREKPFAKFAQKRKAPFFRPGKREKPFAKFVQKRNVPFFRPGKREKPFAQFAQKRTVPFFRPGKREKPFAQFAQKRKAPFFRPGKREKPFAQFGRKNIPLFKSGKREELFAQFAQKRKALLLRTGSQFGWNREQTKKAKAFAQLGWKKTAPFFRPGKRELFKNIVMTNMAKKEIAPFFRPGKKEVVLLKHLKKNIGEGKREKVPFFRPGKRNLYLEEKRAVPMFHKREFLAPMYWPPQKNKHTNNEIIKREIPFYFLQKVLRNPFLDSKPQVKVKQNDVKSILRKRRDAKSIRHKRRDVSRNNDDENMTFELSSKREDLYTQDALVSSDEVEDISIIQPTREVGASDNMTTNPKRRVTWNPRLLRGRVVILRRPGRDNFNASNDFIKLDISNSLVASDIIDVSDNSDVSTKPECKKKML